MRHEHPGRPDVDDGDALLIGDRLDGEARGRARRDDQGALDLGLARVQHPHRDVALDRGQHRAGMQHPAPEVGELGRLGEREPRQGPRVGDQRGVRGHDPVDVGPYLDLVGPDARADDGGAEVGAAAAERRRVPVPGPGDEPAHHRHPPRRRVRPDQAIEPRVRRAERGRRLGEPVVGHQDFARVDMHSVEAALAEQPRHHEAGDALAVRKRGVGQPGARPPVRRGDLGQGAVELVAVGVDEALQTRHVGDDRRRRREQVGADGRDPPPGVRQPTVRGEVDGGHEPVRGAPHRRDHHHRRARGAVGYQPRDAGQRVARRERAAAELHHDHGAVPCRVMPDRTG